MGRDVCVCVHVCVCGIETQLSTCPLSALLFVGGGGRAGKPILGAASGGLLLPTEVSPLKTPEARKSHLLVLLPIAAFLLGALLFLWHRRGKCE